MEKNKKIKWMIIIAAIVVAGAIVAVLLFVNNPSRRLSKLLDLGNRYLESGEYEQAIAAFDEALAIDPQNAEALEKMDDSYLEWADVKVEQNEMDSAVTILEAGYRKTKDIRLQERLAEIRATAVNTEEPETTTKEDADASKEIEEILEVGNEDYEVLGYAYGGVIPVRKNEKWGAINYSGTETIPCEYDNFYAPNKDGYIVMISGSENAEYTLFDNTGKVIYQGTDHVVASNGFYIVARGQDEIRQTNTFIDYYHYDGTLVVSVETQSSWGGKWEPHGFYDGLSIVESAGETSTFGNNKWYTPFDVGFVDENGGVDWHNGDHIQDMANQDQRNREQDQNNADMYIQDGMEIDANAAEGELSVFLLTTPWNSLNHGYYLGYSEEASISVLRDKDHIVSEINQYSIALQGDTLVYEIEGNTITNNDYDSYDEENRIISYPSDGDYYYNYGSKILMYINGKYVLMDIQSPADLKYAVFDYCNMSDENYWLVQSGDQWGYIDHEGEIKALFDDAGAFHNGAAVVVENQTAYLIDENFEKIQELGSADSVFSIGEVFVVNKDENKHLFVLK